MVTAQTPDFDRTARIGLIGGGPAALVAAVALARRGIRTSVFERDQHPEEAPRFNPDRSYTIDISGHGLKAIRHIDASWSFDERMIAFKGLKIPGGRTEEWTLPGWTGSRGDILRALMAVLDGKYREWIALEFNCRVTAVDVETGVVTFGAGSNTAPQNSSTSSSAVTEPVPSSGRPCVSKCQDLPLKPGRIRTTAR